ncbi:MULTISPECIES: PepSY-associated TM helix domain-containing protein [unclassified Undibacterium]|uniref:PepSY-associated TM helix domain-containing protein n=1 Tax=unclassified Undibacterium TaxID=2630295 RepID=UPI002AC91971|nr:MULTISPECIES: PepSY-associated TM helix domain-containing protein [unclassified Undibacterium]MEB0137810.1 PepSY-associated TM helix domain-containing protein [Undibacterium sp. CCC2.1]MEB0170999.1 PepSY-associated TM helix domain-containing protein [Undibacterium sp. CCC1.1]MEB0175044.1 PepSY-associated TM helix domain-containing protein [Undibacterium sp. CCC3.4]MEB0215178.1 PepSY-associated TM helix domain-containing protein [Undibacterium sp. 5I2]WPX44849.1 PepSY-associated TM helix dom
MTFFQKRLLRRLHLSLALPLALGLILLGLSGSILVYIDELDTALNPELLQLSGNVDTPFQATDVLPLLEQLQADPAYSGVSMLELPSHEQAPLTAWYRAGSTDNMARRQIMINPYTGAVLGSRIWGEIGLTRAHLMPMLFHLHRYLLAGEIGKTLVAINGIGLALLAVSGLILWWPQGQYVVWRRALTMVCRGSWKHVSFRFHRAAGFYFSPLLLMLAMSGIYFNKPHWIAPLLNAVWPAAEARKVYRDVSPTHRHIAREEVLYVALKHAQELFPDAKITRIVLPSERVNQYEIRLRQEQELRLGAGATRVYFDAANADIVRLVDPLMASGSERLLGYFFPLHSGQAGGEFGRILISLCGLMPLLLAVSGIVVWIKRR